MIKINFKKNMKLKDHEYSANGMVLKWDRKLRILHPKTSFKMYKLELSLNMR